MPRLNIQVLRNGVERLAVSCPENKTFLIKWEDVDDHCPACGYDIGEHVLDAARKNAEASTRVFIWVDTWGVKACPNCGAPNPNAAGVIAHQGTDA
jgi:uncharacterized Zn finger protein (UPF0148 family)